MRGIMTSPQRNDVATSGHPPVSAGSDVFEVFEDGVPPRFRFGAEARQALAAAQTAILFAFAEEAQHWRFSRRHAKPPKEPQENTCSCEMKSNPAARAGRQPDPG